MAEAVLRWIPACAGMTSGIQAINLLTEIREFLKKQ